MEQRQWLHFLGSRRRAALKSTRGPGNRGLVPPSDPGQPCADQYVTAARGPGRGHLESSHEAGRLARVNALVLSACQSLWALHVGSDPASSVVAHQHRLDLITLPKNCAELIYFAATKIGRASC